MFWLYWFAAGAGALVLDLIIPTNRFHLELSKKRYTTVGCIIMIALPLVSVPLLAFIVAKNLQLYYADRRNPLSSDINEAVWRLVKLRRVKPRTDEVVTEYAIVLKILKEMREQPGNFRASAAVKSSADWRQDLENRRTAVRQAYEELSADQPSA